jgi:O-antigen/teichoic acid export membrane protein
MSGGQPNLVRDAGGLAAARLGVRFLGVAVGLVVARVLGPEGLGQLSLPNLVLVATPYLALGLPDALVRELPVSRHDPEEQDRLVATAWHATVLLGAVVLVLALLFETALRSWIQDPLLLAFAVASGLSNAAYKVSHSDLIGRRRVRDLALLQVLQGVLRAVLVLTLLFTLPASAQVYALHAGVALSLAGSLVWAARRGAVARPRHHRPSLERLARSGPPLALASLALMLLVVGDRLVLSRQLPPAALGIFEQGVLIRDGLLLLPAVLLTLLLPDHSARQGDPAARAGLLADVARQTRLMGVGTPVLLGLTLLQLPWLVGLVLPRFLPGLPVLQVAVLAMAPIFVSYILVSLLMAEGRALWVGAAAAACLAALLAVDALAVPAWSPWLDTLAPGSPAGTGQALGAALAASAAFWLFALAVLMGNARRLGWSRWDALGWLLPSAALTAAALPLGALGWLREWNPWINLAALAASALLLGRHEARTGQLRKLWRARRSASA